MDSGEESLKLQSEFKDCQKVLTAIGDETRQHLLSIMIMEKCSGARVVDIAAKTKTAYTPGVFYKCYRVAAKLIPSSWMVRIVGKAY